MKLVKKLIFSALLTLTTSLGHAHFIWLERIDNGNTAAFFGEPDETPKLFDPNKLNQFIDFILTRDSNTLIGKHEGGHLLFPTKPNANVRLTSKLIYNDYLIDYYVKLGTAEDKKRNDYEFVTVQGKPSTFQLFYQDKPLANTKVLIINPEQWTKNINTDADGYITVPTQLKGQYVIEATYKEDKVGELNGKTYNKIIYICVLTFTAK